MVLLPTALLLWFLLETLSSQDLAVREELRRAYGFQLQSTRDRLAQFFEDQLDLLADTAAEPPATRFANLARAESIDSAVLFDPSGQAIYPARSTTAASLEITYEVETRTKEIRSLLLSGQATEAIAFLESTETRELDQRLRRLTQRSFLLNLYVLALENLDAEDAERERLGRSFSQAVNDYDGAPLISAQRVFLMTALDPQPPSEEVFPTLQAERLALAYLADSRPTAAGVLAPTRVPGLLQLAARDGSGIALFREARLLSRLDGWVQEDRRQNGTRTRLVLPGRTAEDTPAFLTVPLGNSALGWTLELRLEDLEILEKTANQRRGIYVWAGAVGIAGIVLLAALLFRHLRQQARLTRIKNDLVATVSHELKTPLASMRLLVDTLLSGRVHKAQQVKDYLELISRENRRLSRLIESFLTFSRMERSRYTFAFASIRIEEVVRDAIDTVGERLHPPECDFQLHLPDDLPEIEGDRDALVTVVINLLENAWKYTGTPKSIALETRATSAGLELSVTDNGIGLAARTQRKVFDSFYQVDRTLSGASSGFGLGLSIVKFIVEGHSGTMSVSSRLGKGSVFQIFLPFHQRQQ